MAVKELEVISEKYRRDSYRNAEAGISAQAWLSSQLPLPPRWYQCQCSATSFRASVTKVDSHPGSPLDRWQHSREPDALGEIS
jgi:hypothetical protein